jgi:tetraacyldisaccharide 4'-kinase
VIAFCGLGFPQKFYRTLEGEGFDLIETKNFPDHYSYTEADLLKLQSLANEQKCVLVTTRKDWIKLPPSWQKGVYVLDIHIEFEDSEAICNFIVERINRSNDSAHLSVSSRKLGILPKRS